MDYRKEIDAVVSRIAIKLPVGFKNKLIDAKKLDVYNGSQEATYVRATNDNIALILKGERKEFELSIASDLQLLDDSKGEEKVISSEPFSITVAERGYEKQDAIINRVELTGDAVTYVASSGSAELDIALKARQFLMDSDKVTKSFASEDLWNYDQEFSDNNPESAISVSLGDDSLVTEISVDIQCAEELELLQDYFLEQYPSLEFEKTKDIYNLLNKSGANSGKMVMILDQFSGEAQANIVYFGLKKNSSELNKFIDKNYDRLIEKTTKSLDKNKSSQLSI